MLCLWRDAPVVGSARRLLRMRVHFRVLAACVFYSDPRPLVGCPRARCAIQGPSPGRQLHWSPQRQLHMHMPQPQKAMILLAQSSRGGTPSRTSRKNTSWLFWPNRDSPPVLLAPLLNAEPSS